jgi:peptidoglycan/LPS O-acetylase OafA/YrhL
LTGIQVPAPGRSDDPTTMGVDTGPTVVAPTAPPAPAGPPAPGGRDTTTFPGFDGLRAIAALLVLVVHAGFQTTLTLGTSVGPYAARGEMGVAVFFLISGFLLYRPFAASHLAGRPGPDTVGFFIRRFMRIVPLYWLALVVSLVVISDRLIITNVRGLAQCLLFIQGYRRGWALQGLTQAWTLDVEFAFYLFLPLFAYLVGRRARSSRSQLRVELSAVATLFLAGTALHWRMIGTHTGWADGWTVWLPVWWDLFSMGMAVAVVSAWYGREGRQPRWAMLPGSGTACWLAAAFFYWLASTQIGLPLNPIFDPTVPQDLGKHLFYGLFGLFLLLPAVFGRQRKGLVRRFLASRPMVFLGTISYGIYLWHATVIDLVMDHSGWQLWQVTFLPFFSVVFVITVAMATLTNRLVEVPCQNLARDWARRWRTASAARRAARAARPALGRPAGTHRGTGRGAGAMPEPAVAAIPAPAGPAVQGAAVQGAAVQGVSIPRSAEVPGSVGGWPASGSVPAPTSPDAVGGIDAGSGPGFFDVGPRAGRGGGFGGPGSDDTTVPAIAGAGGGESYPSGDGRRDPEPYRHGLPLTTPDELP